MTIDEAIEQEEKMAEKQKELYLLCPASESEFFYCDGTKNCISLKDGENKGCLKCAEEHQQLAEWLKELKQLREQTKYIPISSKSIEEIIDKLELYTVGRPKKDRVQITVEELQNLIDEIKALKQETILDKIRAEINQIASRYTICRERGGMGQVEWEDRLIKESDVLQIIDKYKVEGEIKE